MTIETTLAKAFGLEEDGWARHANPWSVYTRIPIPAMLAGAIWSHTWIGWWSLVPVGVVCVWTRINLRVFPPPRSLDHWASKAVLGEIFWANRTAVPVPVRHRVAPNVLIGINTLGMLVVAWGLVVLDVWAVLCGLAIHMAGKNWFLDRMAILYDDMNPTASTQPTAQVSADLATPGR